VDVLMQEWKNTGSSSKLATKVILAVGNGLDSNLAIN
jgi:hypothetical protein